MSSFLRDTFILHSVNVKLNVQLLTCVVAVDLVSEEGVPLDLAAVLGGVLAVGALVDVDLLGVEVAAVVEDGARVVGEEAAPLARVLPLVVVVRVDDRAWRLRRGRLFGRRR